MGFISAIAEGGASITEGIVSYEGQKKTEKTRLNALNLRMKEISDSTRQQSIDQTARLNKTLAATAAISAAQGGGTAGLTSSTMMSINDINNFSQDENADKLNEIFQQESVGSQKIQAIKQRSSIVPLVEGFLGAGQDAANMYSKSKPNSDPNVSTNSPFASEGQDTNPPASTTGNDGSNQGPDTSPLTSPEAF